MARGRQQTNAVAGGKIRTLRATQIYALDVYLLSGPISERFARKNRVILRSIQICGDQSLEELHRVIFKAFDRKDEHLYEFQVGGRGPMDPKARRYTRAEVGDAPSSGSKPAEDARRTTIGSLGLRAGEAFGYLFDFGDDWWHQIDVKAIEEGIPRGRYPRVTKRVGESPPQYLEEEG